MKYLHHTGNEILGIHIPEGVDLEKLREYIRVPCCPAAAAAANLDDHTAAAADVDRKGRPSLS